MYHYVYKITNLNPLDERKYYIGVRSSECKPEDDVNYWGSSSILKMEIKERGRDLFKKDILEIFNTRKEALDEEIILHEKYNVSLNNEFYNLAKSRSHKYDAKGRVSVRDKFGNTCSLYKDDPRYLSGEYESITKGFISCRNEENKIIMVSLSEFYSNDKYVSLNLGKIPCINKNGETLLLDRNDERFKNGEYWSVHKGKVSCFDENGNFHHVTTEEFKKNTNLIGLSKGKIGGAKNGRAKKIGIYDCLDNLIFLCKGNFEKTCLENNLPYMPLKRSYLKGGVPIYQSKKAKTDAIKNNTLKYINWYAKEIK